MVWTILQLLITINEPFKQIINKMNLHDLIKLKYVLAAAFYSMFGIIILLLSFIIIEKITPEDSWQEIIKNKNIALAIVLAAFILAIGNIIASAIHE